MFRMDGAEFERALDTLAALGKWPSLFEMHAEAKRPPRPEQNVEAGTRTGKEAAPPGALIAKRQ